MPVTIHLRTFDKGLALDPKDWHLFIMWATKKKAPALLSIESWLFHPGYWYIMIYFHIPHINCVGFHPRKNTLSTTIGCFMFHWKLRRSDTLKRLATATNVVTWIGWRVVGSVEFGEETVGMEVWSEDFHWRDLDTPVEVGSLAQMFTSYSLEVQKPWPFILVGIYNQTIPGDYSFNGLWNPGYLQGFINFFILLCQAGQP